ncbi:NAD(P)/FAD-dependent oxidoreductase [Nocardioides daphniae]|uniref:N-acylamino acid racemase n=1 Tax=Nocardioides daphniae TaxID=402297 RepID=A0A4P7UH14_9ACTN|nr:FAD/NAD(P)-binding oxidoreductase [Nocardioides daphniae]QCC78498.1 NAD(P)/FAD-dependent oxidoreductase [Nocardioides daphniae]GGD11933.1 N-acylamino acid racemase [Nocardioides daphniae]
MTSSYDYVIVGAGVAAAKAVQGIRAVDPAGSIGVLGAEPDPPVYRPDLSKTLWLKDDASLEKSQLDVGDADLRVDTRVESLDTVGHTVTLTDGSRIGYGKLLLATGAAPRTTELPAGPRVVYFRTASDFRTLRPLAVPGAEVVVVGGGYIGSEMASALAQNDVRVTLVVDTDHVQSSMFPEALARRVTEQFEAHGVTLVHGTVAGGEVADDSVTVRLDDGTTLTGDAAVLGLGVLPRTEVAEAIGIHLDADHGGLLVDDQLRTSALDVYAAGDVAAYPDLRLGRRRVEHVDAAETMGEAAGRIMAGAAETYRHTPIFWSDLFDAGYEAVGEVTSRHETVEDWKDGEVGGTGVVYYLDGGSVRGVLLWNVWDSTPKAVELIEETARDPLDDPSTLRGRIPFE